MPVLPCAQPPLHPPPSPTPHISPTSSHYLDATDPRHRLESDSPRRHSQVLLPWPPPWLSIPTPTHPCFPPCFHMLLSPWPLTTPWPSLFLAALSPTRALLLPPIPSATATEQPSLEAALDKACASQHEAGELIQRVLCGSLHLVADFRQVLMTRRTCHDAQPCPQSVS